jgi:hypothetical protein
MEERLDGLGIAELVHLRGFLLENFLIASAGRHLRPDVRDRSSLTPYYLLIESSGSYSRVTGKLRRAAQEFRISEKLGDRNLRRMNAQRPVGFMKKVTYLSDTQLTVSALPRGKRRERLNDKRSQKRQVRGTLLTERELETCHYMLPLSTGPIVGSSQLRFGGIR